MDRDRRECSNPVSTVERSLSSRLKRTQYRIMVISGKIDLRGTRQRMHCVEQLWRALLQPHASTHIRRNVASVAEGRASRQSLPCDSNHRRKSVRCISGAYRAAFQSQPYRWSISTGSMETVPDRLRAESDEGRWPDCRTRKGKRAGRRCRGYRRKASAQRSRIC